MVDKEDVKQVLREVIENIGELDVKMNTENDGWVGYVVGFEANNKNVCLQWTEERNE